MPMPTELDRMNPNHLQSTTTSSSLPSSSSTSQSTSPSTSSGTGTLTDIEILNLSVERLAYYIRHGIITSYRVCDIYVKRVLQYDSFLHCFTYFNSQQVYRDARKIDEELSVLRSECIAKND